MKLPVLVVLHPDPCPTTDLERIAGRHVAIVEVGAEISVDDPVRDPDEPSDPLKPSVPASGRVPAIPEITK